jgi:tetratricopeptide (TPR) repeat protein
MQSVCVEWARKRAAAALTLPPEELDGEQHNRIRTLAASLHELADIQREMGQPECVASYNQSYELALRIHDTAGASTAAFNLGTAYKNLSAIHDLDEAENWYRQSLDLKPAETEWFEPCAWSTWRRKLYAVSGCPDCIPTAYRNPGSP